MITKSALLSQVHQRTGALSRVKQDPTLATREEQADLLEDFLRHGATRIAVRTGRIENTKTITVPAGTTVVAAADLGDVRAVVSAIFDSRPLKHISGKEAYLLPREQTGPPVAFGLYAGALYLDSANEQDADLELLYIATSAYPEPGTDPEEVISWLPAEFEKALLCYVLAEWFETIGQFDLSLQYGSQFETHLRDSIKSHQPSRAQRPGFYF